MPITAKGFRYPAGTDPLSQGDDAIHNLASDVDAFPGWAPVGGAAGAVLAKTAAADYAVAWTPPHYVPAGGASGQVLGKLSAADYDAAWLTPSGGSGGGGAGALVAAQLAADVTVSSSTEATPTDVIAIPSWTADGTAVAVEIEGVARFGGGSYPGGIALWDGTTELVRLWFSPKADDSANGMWVSTRRVLTPAAGTISAWKVRSWWHASASTRVIVGGASATPGAAQPPFQIRVYKA